MSGYADPHARVGFSAIFTFDRLAGHVVEILRILALEKSVDDILVYCRESRCDLPFPTWSGGNKICEPIEREKSRPLSLIAARNALAATSQSDYLLFVDERSLPEPGFADALASEISEQERDVALFPACRRRPPSHFSPPDDFLLVKGLGLRKDGFLAEWLRRDEKNPYEADMDECVYPLACTIAIKAAHFRALRGFDAHFTHSSVEEFCLAAATSGIKPKESRRAFCDITDAKPMKTPLSERKKMFLKHFDGFYRSGVIDLGVAWMRVRQCFGRAHARGDYVGR
ncbi:MAG: hypothetical protein ABW189_04775 [Rickettsiales bacterium]